MTTRIPPTEISGPSGALAKHFARKLLGRVPESIGVLWHHVPVLRAGMAYGRKLKGWDRCDAGLKSLAHMATASLIGCSWCLDYNYFEARNAGLDLDKAREVPRWRESDVFTPLERDVLAYAEAVSQTPPTVTDAMVAGLLAQIGPAALIELTTVIGYANLTSRGNVAMGIESDGFAQACGLEPLAAASRVPGRSSGVASPA